MSREPDFFDGFWDADGSGASEGFVVAVTVDKLSAYFDILFIAFLNELHRLNFGKRHASGRSLLVCRRHVAEGVPEGVVPIVGFHLLVS